MMMIFGFMNGEPRAATVALSFCCCSEGSRSAKHIHERKLMSFGLYIVGFLIVIGGLLYGAAMLHVPTPWIVVGGIVLTGVGILTGVKSTRQKDPAA